MKKKQAISLIVLVITIIVMIVLAGAIILTLSNSGIIDKASDAVEKSDAATVKQIASLGWAEAYAEHGADIEKLKAGVLKALENNNLNTDDYGMIVTTSGVEIVKGWIQDGLVVRKGKQEVNIGDFIVYDETVGDTVELEDTEWQVLGASNEGDLLILSSSNVTDGLVWDTSTGEVIGLKDMQDFWLTAEQQLDDSVKQYGKGKNATGVRCIKIEDIERVMGWNKTTSEKGTLEEYGNKITYTYDATTQKVSYTSTNGNKGTYSGTHSNGFHYYDGTDFVVANTSGITITLKNNAPYYVANGGAQEIGGTEAYTMLFGEDKQYTLASTYYSTGHYGICGVYKQWIGKLTDIFGAYANNVLWDSFGNVNPLTLISARAVVSLSGDTNLTELSEDGWIY